MVRVAVAGGSGGIGLYIVEGIVETGKHEVVVLSRTATHPILDKLGVRAIAVFYDDPASLAQALDGVHTVISTIPGGTEDTLVKPQLALLDAAVKAGVKRFAPSEFSVHGTHPLKVRVAEAVKNSGLEYTLYDVGMLMNYFAVGTPGVGHIYPFATIDIEHCKATIPGDGSTYLIYTRAEDVGKFVAASLDLNHWPEVSQIRGDRKTLKNIIQLAEEVRGRKFDITYVSKEDLLETLRRCDEKTELPSHERFGNVDVERVVAGFWLLSFTGNPFGYEGKKLNDLFSELQPMGIEDFLRKWWGDL